MIRDLPGGGPGIDVMVWEVRGTKARFYTMLLLLYYCDGRS